MKVVKFGGSSVANAEQISKIIGIVTADADRRLVVVSAPGKRHGDDTKVTEAGLAELRKAWQSRQDVSGGEKTQ